MIKLFKIFCMFVVTVLFLSIEIKDKTIFAHIHVMISPVTQMAQNAAENFFDSSTDKTKTYSKRLFENSIPKVKDSVKSKMSSNKKSSGPPLEEITQREKKELDQLIKNHN